MVLQRVLLRKVTMRILLSQMEGNGIIVFGVNAITFSCR